MTSPTICLHQRSHFTSWLSLFCLIYSKPEFSFICELMVWFCERLKMENLAGVLWLALARARISANSGLMKWIIIWEILGDVFNPNCTVWTKVTKIELDRHRSKTDCPCKKMKFKSSNRAEGKKLEQRKVLLLLTGAKKILNKNNNSFNETRFETTFQPYFHVLKIVCVLELEWKMDSLQSSTYLLWTD